MMSSDGISGTSMEPTDGSSTDEMRPSSHPPFWDVRYAREPELFGASPSAFVIQHADLIPPGAQILEIGAGDGRTLRGLARSRDVSGVGVDFSREAIATGRRRAAAHSLDVTFEHADIRSWSPSSTWDVVIVTFVQLLPPERSTLYAGMRTAVRPGGLVLGQWFRPDHLSGAFDRVGPNRPDRMVPPAEVETAFKSFHDLSVTSEVVSLNEGRLRGEAATIHLVARRPA